MEHIKEMAAYVAEHVENYEARLHVALDRIWWARCPLRVADEALYEEIIDAVCEWLDDHEISIENDMDWEELIEGKEGIIWEC